MSFIELKNVTYGYKKDTPVLTDVSFDVQEGEFVCILGHNGSGKSTLAKLIAGLAEANSGTITINNITIDEKTIGDVRLDIGMIFQNPDNQFVGITVKDDIAFGLENRNLDINEMNNRIDFYSKAVNVNDLLNINPEKLSGGQKQRVAIAGVLACKPKIIIFDESTSMLDPKSVKEVISEIKKIKGKTTILYITHNLEEALLADKVIVMNKGKIVLYGTPNEIFKEKQVLKDASLDILDQLKLIDLIDKNRNIKYEKEIKDILWQSIYQK